MPGSLPAAVPVPRAGVSASSTAANAALTTKSLLTSSGTSPPATALRDAVAKLDPDVSEPALAFFGMAFGPERTGMEQIVLETDWDDAQVVLKLDFEGKTWKRVRKKAKK